MSSRILIRLFREEGFSLAKPRFLAEVVQKLKFPNNSIKKNHKDRKEGNGRRNFAFFA
jgi:hypothetical protein